MRADTLRWHKDNSPGSSGKVLESKASGIQWTSSSILQGAQGALGTQGTQGIQGITGPVSGDANQVVYKNASNIASGSANLTFDGTSLSIKGYSLAINARGSVSGATTIDLTLGNYVTATIAGSTTFTFSGQSSTNTSGFVLELTNGGSAAITWPSVKWPGGTAPTLTVSGVDLLAFITDDNGTTWRGVASMLDSK